MSLAPEAEAARLAALARSGALDAPATRALDDLVRLAAALCEAPFATLSFVDHERECIRAGVGIAPGEIARDRSLAARTVARGGPLVIADATADARADGNPLVVGAPGVRAWAGAPLLTDDGDAIGVIGVMDRAPREFTDAQVAGLEALARQAMAQLQLYAVTRQLDERERERRDAESALQAEDVLDRLKNEFVATVSHELRTPLTSIRGSLGLIEAGVAGSVPPQVLELARIARSNADRLIRLINDILDLDKMAAGRIELRRAALDPSDVVTAVLESMQRLAEGRGIRLVARIGRHSAFLGDRDRVIQVLTNLVSNAVKFSPEGGTVTVRVLPGEADAAHGTVRFVVEDAGPGVPPQQLGNLFKKFGQLDQSDARRRGGTGLGLAISKAIVEQHEGTIGVASQPGERTEFWFELPLVPDHAATLGHEPDGPHTILVVEDDGDLADILSIFLRHEGYLVAHARTLADARRTVRDLVPSLVLLDVVLPDGNGLDFADELGAEREHADVPVIVLSGSEPGREPHPRVSEWITKPFDEKQLFRALRAALRTPGSPRVLIVEDDEAMRTVIATRLAALGVECLLARDGVEALALTRREAPDLIVLDVGLPVMDGFALVETLRHERAKSIPLIVYTGRDLTAAERTALTLGTTHHLVKSRASDLEVYRLARELLAGLSAARATAR